MGCLHSVRSLYVTLKEFTPDLQIFYTFFLFGLNVQVFGVKLSLWNGPFSWSITLCQKRKMLLSKILPQTTKKFTQIYLPYLWHYATLFLAVICRFLACIGSWWLYCTGCPIELFWTAKNTSWATSRPPVEKILMSLSQEVARYSRLQHTWPEWVYSARSNPWPRVSVFLRL